MIIIHIQFPKWYHWFQNISQVSEHVQFTQETWHFPACLSQESTLETVCPVDVCLWDAANIKGSKT